MKWIALVALAMMAACGPLTQSNPTLNVARGITAGGEDDSSAPGLFDILSREFIDAQVNEIMLVSVISRGASAVVVRGGNNGSKVTWLSPDGISVTFDQGVLIATRGLGDDLMGADATGVLAGFRGTANYLRKHSYLTGRDQEVTRDFTCSMVLDRSETITIYDKDYATQVFVETCEGGGDTFRNTYWRASDGVIWQARQWISAEVGYLGYQRL